MVYLHEAPYGDRFVRHWANEVAENSNEDFGVATFKIRQIETGAVYDEAVDVLPCRYTYEATDEPIETEDAEATESDYLDALGRFGVSE